jgi:hypothetical protein
MWSVSTGAVIMPRPRIHSTQSRSATQAPVIEAVRVPPSACSTSQSMEICRSPSAGRSTTARSERPIRRWISWVRPDGLPAVTSRRVRVWVARGSMPYSAVTQPLPPPRSHGGTFSSRLAVQMHVGIAEADQARALGVAGDAALEGDGAQLVGGTLGGSHEAHRAVFHRANPVFRTAGL